MVLAIARWAVCALRQHANVCASLTRSLSFDMYELCWLEV